MQSTEREQKASARPSPVAPRRRGFLARVKVGIAAAVGLIGAGVGASACLDRPLCDTDCIPRTTNIFVQTVAQKSVDKIDLLFMIDNSISMADKQAVLKEAVPDLVRRLVSPNCVSADGIQPNTPPDPTAQCATGYDREFTPIKNIHIGVITSSLGGHGAPNCDGTSEGIRGEEENDKGHLIASRPRFGAELGQYSPTQPPDAAGFLNWNPPPNGTLPIQPFSNTFQAMVTATDEFGCGYEAQLEAIYRFLIDPNPYERIEVRKCSAQNQADCAFPVGTDGTIKAQRAAFLRPDSLVAIIMVTDENDCSIIERDQGYYAARADDVDLPRAHSICNQNPNDKCCVSCISGVPSGCSPDPLCETQKTVPEELDPPNLRCFNQQRRFGINFLYPTQRYVNALTQSNLCTSRDDLLVTSNTADCPDRNGDSRPDIEPNPLFSDLTASGKLPRDASLVFFAGIIGVPWQDLEQTTNPKTNAPWPQGELHYKVASQFGPDGIWSKILGDPNNPASPVPPSNQLMIESVSPRGGNDGQGNPLVGINGGVMANPVNGHEWGNTRQDDLMYACVFKLKDTRDCATISGPTPDLKPGCDCEEVRAGDNNPLCQNDDGTYGRVQRYAKAYPGLRELQVLKDYGANSIVASICARNLTNQNAQDYGYRPAVDAIVDRLKEALTGKCLPRALEPDETGVIPCSIIEVRPGRPGCDESRGRLNADDSTIKAAQAQLEREGACGASPKPDCNNFTFCTLKEAGEKCHVVGEQPEAGWCYVDPASTAQKNANDDPALVEKCLPNEKRIIRFVDPENRTPESDAKVLIACFGSTNSAAPAPTATGAGGEAAGAGGAAPMP